MNRFVVFCFCVTFCVVANGQSSYAEAIQQGDIALDKGDYKMAINKYFSAEAFDVTKKAQVKEKVNKVFDAIDGLRKKAELALIDAKTQNKLAVLARMEAEKQKDNALEAKRVAEVQKDIAQKALRRNIEFQEKSVGKSYQGGIIFYSDSARNHGLIAAEKDFDSTYTWLEAKKKCETYVVTVDGVDYRNWYLPSKEELDLLFLNREIVGGFKSAFYWSSTEDYDGFKSDAMGHYFNPESRYKDTDFNKDSKNRVRAIRAF